MQKSSPPLVELTPAQIAEFYERGFLAIPQISSPEEVEFLRGVFDRLFEQKAGRDEGAQFDMVTHDEDEEKQALPAIINPVNFAPELRDTVFRTNAAAIARQLLGPKVTASFEHAILKPPRYGAATPWHQDEATRVDASFDYEQLSIWMPLQEATIENGCIQYIAGSHKGDVLPHRSPKNDPRIHAIECAGGFDPSAAIPCPLPAGGAVMHLGRTLHCAGPNNSDIPRRAYILAFEIPPKPSANPRSFYWNLEKQTANLDRKRRWRKNGGILVEFGRKLRGGMWRQPGRIVFEARRAIRALLKRST
jgi:ectoine hydroxylase-related dioxygenase (phytanoyl-CoA dioxygenase family)